MTAWKRGSVEACFNFLGGASEWRWNGISQQGFGGGDLMADWQELGIEISYGIEVPAREEHVRITWWAWDASEGRKEGRNHRRIWFLFQWGIRWRIMFLTLMDGWMMRVSPSVGSFLSSRWCEDLVQSRWNCFMFLDLGYVFLCLSVLIDWLIE